MTSVLLIEDSLLFRSALETALRRAGFLVTSHTSKATPGKHARPSAVVLLDIVTFTGGPSEIEELVKRWSASAPVLLLGRDDRMEQILTGLRAGAAGCVNQTVSPRQLRNAAATLAAGGTWCERSLFQKILQHLSPMLSPAQLRLTKREAEVLSHLVQGQTNREIAHLLGLTEQAIKIHVSNLLRKTGTYNRTSLSLLAIRQGLIPA